MALSTLRFVPVVIAVHTTADILDKSYKAKPIVTRDGIKQEPSAFEFLWGKKIKETHPHLRKVRF
ncbi:MAG TPA: hypothetical protein VJR22_00235 [Candidatus Nitrosotalea sp.]|nr:hypothetical protein [Nitrososphaerota archaeon]HKU32258.1 hypothetical protein [Candidatus Nitrosotalea sp.]